MGFKKVQDVNTALSTKLGWKVLNDPDNLWDKVVSTKYLMKGESFRQKNQLMLQQHRSMF